jgi:hypothetical protein
MGYGVWVTGCGFAGGGAYRGRGGCTVCDMRGGTSWMALVRILLRGVRQHAMHQILSADTHQYTNAQLDVPSYHTRPSPAPPRQCVTSRWIELFLCRGQRPGLVLLLCPPRSSR